MVRPYTAYREKKKLQYNRGDEGEDQNLAPMRIGASADEGVARTVVEDRVGDTAVCTLTTTQRVPRPTARHGWTE